MKFLLLAIGVMMTLLVALLIFVPEPSQEFREREARQICRNSMTAFSMSKRFVQERLRAPSTAVFPSFSADGVRVSQEVHCKFTVAAYVDAQNAFGVQIRNGYQAKVVYRPESRLWFAEEVIIDP